jgi:hypothetical protein
VIWLMRWSCFVNWRRQHVGPAATYWEIGIALLPEARGHGYGTQAHRPGALTWPAGWRPAFTRSH